MNPFRTVWSRIHLLWQRREVNREIDEELRFHLEQRTAENSTVGMTPEEPAREARKRFGNLQSVREDCRDARWASFGETMIKDIRFGLRMLTKAPGFTATAVLSLGLGIGAATTLFSVFHALVLNPFPYPHSEQIVYVRSNTGQPLSAPDFKDIREQSQSLVELGVYQPTRLNFGLEQPESLPAIQCTAGVLRALEVKPTLGRWLDEADEQAGAAPVAVISHALWIRAFNGDPAIVGRTIRLDGRETEVVGVMPAAFEFTSPWYEGHDYQLWTPLRFDAEQLAERGSHWLLGLGRLKSGVTVAEADAEIKAIGARLARTYPATNTRKPLLVRSIREEITHQTAAGMRPLAAAVALLMLVACANVAGLLLARGTQRQGEFGVRLAMGASRGALLRQLLSETVLLGLLGCAVGIVFATWGVSAFRHLIPSALVIEARRAAIQVNGLVLLFAAVVGLVSALLAALFPAFSAVRTPVVGVLNNSGRTQAGSRHRHRFLRGLVVAQVAVAMALAYAGILFAASYLNVFRANRTLNTDHVLSAEIVPQGERYRDVAARVRLWNALIERVGALPGVQHAGMTTKLPLEGGNNFDVLVDDQAFDPAVRRPLVENSGVSPEYFAAMGLGWLRGQPLDFTSVRGSNFPVVINQTMARKCWPDANPLGRRVRLDRPRSPFNFEVVGVVEDVRQWGAEHSALPELYYACTLEGTPEEALPNSAYLVVRAAGDTQALVPAIRQELASLDPSLPLANVRTMGEVLEDVSSGRRLSAGLINLFMGITLLLTAIGIYGTLSFVLLQRTREIGVRIAVGAQRRQIFSLVIKQAGLWLLGGLAIGLSLSAACSFVLRSLVYAINPLNASPLLLGAGLVGSAVCVACLTPALRAARTDPLTALRCE